MKSIQIKAPAKINLGLNITSKRTDGYHNLLTLFYPLHDLYDALTFVKSDKNNFIYNESVKELSGDNLVLKAKNLIENFVGEKINVSILLEKKIPIGAGLGGGSSDAATTLISLNELYSLNLSHDALMNLAVQLGSDVPFFLSAKPALAKSRGEILTPVQCYIQYPILIINPGIHISTKEAFGRISDFSKRSEYVFKNPNSFDDIKDFRNNFTNDFENSVFNLYPEIEEIKKTLYNAGAGFALMTGSGSTVFGIFESDKVAQKAMNLFPKNYFRFISRPVTELI